MVLDLELESTFYIDQLQMGHSPGSPLEMAQMPRIVKICENGLYLEYRCPGSLINYVIFNFQMQTNILF
jgi:hypothetical protein